MSGPALPAQGTRIPGRRGQRQPPAATRQGAAGRLGQPHQHRRLSTPGGLRPPAGQPRLTPPGGCGRLRPGAGGPHRHSAASPQAVQARDHHRRRPCARWAWGRPDAGSGRGRSAYGHHRQPSLGDPGVTQQELGGGAASSRPPRSTGLGSRGPALPHAKTRRGRAGGRRPTRPPAASPLAGRQSQGAPPARYSRRGRGGCRPPGYPPQRHRPISTCRAG